MTRCALVIGAAGQDGSLLCDLLLEKGYTVHGVSPYGASLRNLSHIPSSDRFTLHNGDLLDPISLYRILDASHPDELYNVADIDAVGWSFSIPCLSFGVTAGAVASLLAIVKDVNPSIRVFQALSATMFGDAPPPQNETTPFNPQSPYACAKAAAYYLCRYYRQCHGMHVSTAILFNHDSLRRSEGYLLHKIARGAVRVARGEQSAIILGDLDQLVDIGYAGEYMDAAWRMLQQEDSSDYVIGTGYVWTVQEMAEEALRSAGVTNYLDDRIAMDLGLLRSGLPTCWMADTGKAKRVLGWEATRRAGDLIAEFVAAAKEGKL